MYYGCCILGSTTALDKEWRSSWCHWGRHLPWEVYGFRPHAWLLVGANSDVNQSVATRRCICISLYINIFSRRLKFSCILATTQPSNALHLTLDWIAWAALQKNFLRTLYLKFCFLIKDFQIIKKAYFSLREKVKGLAIPSFAPLCTSLKCTNSKNQLDKQI